MSFNKKGVNMDVVGKLIVALLIIALLWGLFINLGDFLYETGSKAACQNWVYRNSVSYVKEVIGNLEDSPCVTTQETISSIKDRNELYEKLAQNMYDCWDQYGRGESDFYSNFDWGSSNTYCRICSEIKFDEAIKKDIKEINVDDFENYLSNHNPPNNKLSYAEFFIKVDRAKIDFGDNIKIPIENNNVYTMFVVNKRSQCSLGVKECLASVFEKAITTVGLTYLGGNVPIVGGFIKGVGSTGWGTLAIISVGTGAFLLADGSVLYPSLWLTYSQDYKTINSCDYIYYKPEGKPLNFLSK